jgi:Uma2 family endonuclease
VSLIPAGAPEAPILYPDSDGKPMADNTKQGRWIFVLYGNIAALFRHRLDVFVAQNLLWYALQGHPDACNAPDVLVAFGRPQGDRGSYKQWEEDGVPVTVVFEVLSPGNTDAEMARKFAFYEEYGVEEYYIYDPDKDTLQAFFRHGTALLRQRPAHNLVSPRLRIRFDLSGPEMVVYYPDGTPFLTFEQLREAWEQAKRQAEQAQRQAEQAQRQAEQAQRQAEQAQRQTEEERKERRAAEEQARQEHEDRLAAERQAQQAHEQRLAAQRQAEEAHEQRLAAQRQLEQQRHQTDQARQRTARLAELSRKARRGQASPDELRELERLEEEASGSS